MISEFATPVIAGATVLSNVVFFICLALYVGSLDARAWADRVVSEYFNSLVFLVTFVAFAGSLTYSEIVGFPPCDLCWFQRICMYPSMLLALVAGVRKAKDLVYYVLPLSAIGMVIALYHSFILWGGKSILPCTQQGSACAKIYVFEHGYVTIPVMALSCFVYLITLCLIYLKTQKKKGGK